MLKQLTIAESSYLHKVSTYEKCRELIPKIQRRRKGIKDKGKQRNGFQVKSIIIYKQNCCIELYTKQKIKEPSKFSRTFRNR